jgi:hypothetical protein
MQKCGARNGCLFKRGCKSVLQELAAWKKGVAADVPPEEVVANSAHLLCQNTDIGYSQIWLL